MWNGHSERFQEFECFVFVPASLHDFKTTDDDPASRPGLNLPFMLGQRHQFEVGTGEKKTATKGGQLSAKIIDPQSLANLGRQ